MSSQHIIEEVHLPALEGTSTENHFKSLTPIKKLGEAKFPVYLASVPTEKDLYVMKVFPHNDNGKPSHLFKNEARFLGLNHKNIIVPVYYETDKKCYMKGKKVSTSFTLTEYAPYGDFFDFTMNHTSILNDMVIRTYFKQLIEGIEYLHSKKIAHLDIKLENLMVGNEFQLKIIDFDMSHKEGDKKIISLGTRYYRAPEVVNATTTKPMAADIFSAGIILFVWKSGGRIPQTENMCVQGVNLYDLLQNDNQGFWQKHCELQGKEASYFSEEFRELFSMMTRGNPDERATIESIKASKWYNGPVFSDDELKAYMERQISAN